MDCPLCGKNRSILLGSYELRELRKLWQNAFSFDPFDEVKFEFFQKRQCLHCSLIYYTPSLFGDEAFYERLSKFSWYYESNKWEFDIASRVIADVKPDSFLEIGCGRGVFLERISQAVKSVEGLDINREAVKECRKRGLNATIGVPGNLKNKYDVIALFEVLEHLDGLPQVLLDIVNHLNPRGRLILAVPNPKGYINDIEINLLDMPPHHNSCWPKETFEYIAAEYDMKIVGYYKEPLRYNHYLSYLKEIACKHRKMMLPGLKKRLFSFIQNGLLNVFAPFYYIEHRGDIVGQTHLVVLEKNRN